MATKEVDLEEAQEELQKIRSDMREKDKTLRKESREVETLQDKITSLEVCLSLASSNTTGLDSLTCVVRWDTHV